MTDGGSFRNRNYQVPKLKEQLCGILMDQEAEFAEYIRHPRTFESTFLHHLAPFHQQLHRWE